MSLQQASLKVSQGCAPSGSQVDLSYERLGDKQIRHQHKQATLGSMINNVSHELKNICGAILGFADLGLEPGTTAEQAQEYLLEIQKVEIVERNS